MKLHCSCQHCQSCRYCKTASVPTCTGAAGAHLAHALVQGGLAEASEHAGGAAQRLGGSFVQSRACTRGGPQLMLTDERCCCGWTEVGAD